MGKPKQWSRSMVREARELGVEFDLEVDANSNGALVLTVAGTRHTFASNAALTHFLDGVRAGKAMAEQATERLSELARVTGLEDDC